MNVELQRTESQPTAVSENSPLNFEGFARQPEYVEVNANLIREFAPHLPNEFYHVDVATGTGMVPKLLIKESQRTGKKGKIICVDPNRVSLEIARDTTPQSDNVSVEFIEGPGQDLKTLLAGKIPEGKVDGVSILDAIHEIPGEDVKKLVLSSMADILKPGGVLVLNSAFTTYGMKPNRMAWGRWKSTACTILTEKKYGNKNTDIEAIEIYSPEEYRQMIEETGLTVIYDTKKIVNLSKKALVAISLYPEFINGVFRDMIDQENFTLEEKSQALTDALEGVEFISRGWYEIIAQKPLA